MLRELGTTSFLSVASAKAHRIDLPGVEPNPPPAEHRSLVPGHRRKLVQVTHTYSRFL